MTTTTTTSSIKNCRGFTLIELLVVMGIISSLIAVALPRYASYRASAFDSRAEIDLRSVAMAEEAYFLENDAYLPCSGESCALLPGIKKLSAGVELTVTVRPTGFTGSASHAKGTGKTFTWDSDLGGLGGK
jgi:prepilin-type N-terminal cleavage/methylation domain-containing protein